ncbi:MAG: recombinase family protein [Streptosporangiaceae bacterium]
MRIGYARVSTNDQHPEAQADRLMAAGCERVYVDRGVSGALARRPEWDRCRDTLREADVLVVVRLDRIGRSVKNLIDVVNELGERGVNLIALDQQVDTTTPTGKLVFHVLSAISEFERDIIKERTADGLAAARARGRVGGRKRKLSDAQVALARRLYDEVGDDGKRAHTVDQIAGMVGVTRGTIYRALERQEREAKASTGK